MKMMHKLNLVLTASGAAIMALTAGCAAKEPMSPPPGAAIVGFAPDYCFWDGYEYIGWDDYYYYYWDPNHVWRICDPVKVQRVNVWLHDHPNWRTRVWPQAQYRPVPIIHPQSHPQPAPFALPEPPVRRGHARHNLHDHD